MRYTALRHSIDLQVDQSNAGDEDLDYETAFQGMPCNIVAVSGGEIFRGRQLQDTTRYVIETRFFRPLKSTWRLVNCATGEEYSINNVIDVDGRQRRMMIEAYTEE